MIKIGICDDSAEARFALSVILERQFEERNYDLTCYEFSSGEGLIKWLTKHPNELDVLFLDIEMPGINGMDTAKQIRRMDSNLMLVFVTGFADYVFDGYNVGALSYLLKPVSPKKLSAVITRILGVIELRAPNCYTLKNTEGIFSIPKDEILYLQSEGRQIHLITLSRKYTFYKKMDDVHAELGDGFVRIHQRYLVQCSAVDSFTGENVTVGKHVLPVSRSNRANAMEAIAKHLLGQV